MTVTYMFIDSGSEHGEHSPTAQRQDKDENPMREPPSPWFSESERTGEGTPQPGIRMDSMMSTSTCSICLY